MCSEFRTDPAASHRGAILINLEKDLLEEVLCVLEVRKEAIQSAAVNECCSRNICGWTDVAVALWDL